MLAGLSGFAGGVRDIVVPYLQRRDEELLREQYLQKQQDYKDNENTQLLDRSTGATLRNVRGKSEFMPSDTTNVLNSDGTYTTLSGKVQKGFSPPTIPQTPEQKANQAYLEEQAKLKAQKEAGKLVPGTAKPTVAQNAVDRNFGVEYSRYLAQGGYADIENQIKTLEGVRDELRGGKSNLTGPVISAQPDWTRKRLSPKSMEAQQAVEQSVQRTLKQTLGGQFTEKEGALFMQRGYDPALPEKDNAVKLDRAIKTLKTMAKAKEDAINYFEENGTLSGFKGKLPSMNNDADSSELRNIGSNGSDIKLQGDKANRLLELRRKQAEGTIK